MVDQRSTEFAVSRHVLELQRNCCIIATMTRDFAHKPARWRRLLTVALRRQRLVAVFELLALVAMILAAIATFIWFRSDAMAQRLFSPPTVVLILLLNLAPTILLIMLIGRRIARRRANQSIIGTSGQLHVRLVALFSFVATVPMLIMLMVASLLFQYGVDIWYSKRARAMFENTTALSQQLYAENQQRVVAETNAMAGDVAQMLTEVPIDGDVFANEFAYQVYRRELSEGAIISITPKNGVQALALVNPYERPKENWVSAAIAKDILSKPRNIFGDTGKRMESVTPLPGSKNLFLYASRVSDSKTLDQAKRAALVLKDYNALIERSGRLQVILNVTLYLMSVLIMLVAVWVALRVADRLVKPVGELVGAARRVASGDLDAQVTPSKARDEVGVLSRAFNRMTERLGDQNRALVASNGLLDRRRAFTEAILSSVTAGVIAVGKDLSIRMMNPPASALLNADGALAVDQPLSAFSTELAAMIAQKSPTAVVQIVRDGEARTLAVKSVKDEVGYVLTFDDITQQLVDQRRAAWSDVARRVAHEIKNPLTPIQLAAERLQRRFSSEITSDQPAFERLTGTIVRQVGDLRRMVDEFSSFARMPKPVFALEQFVDVVREAVFLQEVANPSISFKISAPTPSPELVCDRRQLAQAISNVVKNGVEAILQKADQQDEAIAVSIVQSDGGRLILTITDTGIGLPVERDRIAEPYMTTRPGGTGLGLAIVNKIIEEHKAEMSFADRLGGGTEVIMRFDPSAIAASAADAFSTSTSTTEDAVPVGLTRGRKR
jgi:two-component system, NtrC family, nitrogen regulation sensor histidine kinase NtrY